MGGGPLGGISGTRALSEEIAVFSAIVRDIFGLRYLSRKLVFFFPLFFSSSLNPRLYNRRLLGQSCDRFLSMVLIPKKEESVSRWSLFHINENSQSKNRFGTRESSLLYCGRPTAAIFGRPVQSVCIHRKHPCEFSLRACTSAMLHSIWEVTGC